MNADLKRVRDSSLDAPSSSKRRAIGSGSSPGHSPSSSHLGKDYEHEEEDDLEDWMRVVETHRKEALFRQMLEYRRTSQREAARAKALESQRRNLEACFRSVEACWAQLVSSLRDRAGNLPVPDESLFDNSFDPTLEQDAVDDLVKSRLEATLRLVAVFADSAAGKHTSDLGGDLRQRFDSLQLQSTKLQTDLTQARSQLDETRQSRDDTLRDLQRTEKRLDKQRMDMDKERAAWKTQRESSSAASAKPMANGSGHSTPNARASEAPEAKPVVVGSVPMPDETEQRCAELDALVKSRLQQLETLRAEHTTLTQQVDKLKVQAHNPSEEVLRQSPFFQVYLQRLATSTAGAEALQQRFEQAEQKLDQLRDSNLDFREAVIAEARAEVEALREKMGQKDVDLARLRGQRDELNAELTERRVRDTDKMRFADEMEQLCSKREERINFLCSEVRRLKGKLAAKDGAEGYLAFLKDGPVDGDYIKALEKQLQAAKDQVSSLTDQLKNAAEGDAAAAASETAVRSELEAARRRLAEYERILGPSASPDVKSLTERLQQDADVRKKLELQLAEAEEATNALYQELEGVNKLWEELDQTLKTKVFELKDGELRMQRLSTEKAKADNKYFTAMRNKEGVEGELRAAQRTVGKQLKLIERAKDVEKSQGTQIAQQEKTLTSLKNTLLELQTQLATAASGKKQFELRLQATQTTLGEAQQIAQTRVAEAAADKSARAKAVDELQQVKSAHQKLKERHEQLTSTANVQGGSAADVAVREERAKLLKLLRCSCCELNFKQQVITKCMHTFCKECLDKRIETRQRKCPACGIVFSKEDCKTLYWQ
ncbi:hypothetical protein CcaverHIS002_0702410 [Cutaneotrichosporon cavernicola]|uniref:E3 ubiquitin protein ligase n=1 Tax=Cutaneotrichosporon cavernicola TaxID=279322 RepID=A0AA48L9V5_9TREE|nr:uncharacterized protein CcaverHIS019_0702500 [Cutaneotrichosporon cavernicola]BEI86895.1 hypothetical protein CcaverHIS002_0702410 [Cutaneotrichosporon cavernicola]BEI94669.1 hypothetical protein CcaverHIS019_0702500 [Cutaneotrichosporon cavernicola]BEJ02444.1 hypothetical protein CcaverHIS631_0702390 [Cutaneotrichosporon cavernicola]BEJ10203.1 hypothetical protein CcaverHIS641_0702380 [Cutaneotrichosporon cavernicola]